MSAAWTINNQTPAALGVAVCTRQLRSFAASSVTLEIVDAALATAQLLGWGTAVVIKRDGVVWFSGKARRQSTVRSGNSYRQQIEVLDAWNDLERIHYKQIWNPTADHPAGEETNKILLGATDVAGIFYDNPASGLVQITVAQEITRLLNYAVAKGAALSLGELSCDFALVEQEVNNQTIAELLRRVSESVPTLVSWFDYTTGALHIKELGGATTSGSIDASAPGVTSLRVGPRNDLLVASVIVRFEHGSGPPDTIEVQTASEANNGKNIEITLTIPAGAGGWDTEHNGQAVSGNQAQLLIPQQYADAILARWGTLHYEGSVTLKADDVSAVPWLGKVLNITGALPAWLNMRAPVLSQTDDVRTGETTLNFGPQPETRPPRRNTHTPQAARNGGSPADVEHEPLETYLEGNSIHVAQGTCGRDSDGNEVVPDHTGVAEALATIGIGGTKNVYLGVSFQPNVQAFTVKDDDGDFFTEYSGVGTGIVRTAKMTLSRTAPPAQGALVNYLTGAVDQVAVMYFLHAIVTWPGGPAPQVQIIQKGNKDLLFVKPSRVYLRADA